MTEVFISHAEDLFLRGKFVDAYKTAKLARELDPNFGSVGQFEAAFRVHVAAKNSRTHSGEINWYELLGLETSATEQEITHRVCSMGKIIHPDNHCSAAAPGAYRLLLRAFEILGDEDEREAFDMRSGYKQMGRNVPSLAMATRMVA